MSVSDIVDFSNSGYKFAYYRLEVNEKVVVYTLLRGRL